MKQDAEVTPSTEKQMDWKDSWFVVASEGDGAESVVVRGLTAVQAELTRMMWCGDDPAEIPDDIKEMVAELDDADNWSMPYPGHEPMHWQQRFEDGGIRVLRLTGRLQKGTFSFDGLPFADAELLSRLSGVEEMRRELAAVAKAARLTPSEEEPEENAPWMVEAEPEPMGPFSLVEAIEAQMKLFDGEFSKLDAKLAAAEAEAERLHQRLEQAKKLQDLTTQNEIRWMQKTEAAEKLLGSMREALRITSDSLKEMAEWHGGAHDDDCPLDDTCDCSGKPFNDRVNNACKLAESVLSAETVYRNGGIEISNPAKKRAANETKEKG